MTDREKQIEEMAKVMCGGCPNNKECMHCLCQAWYNAEALYNAGYRKQSEVDRSKQEIEELKESIEYGNEVCKNCQDDKDKGLQQAKKKVAREIFAEIEFDIHQLMFDKDEHRAIAIEGVIAQLKKKYTDGARRKEDG